MKQDIQTRDDLYEIVKLFYQKLLKDDLMHPFFIDFQNEDLREKHLQVLVNFWEDILFFSNGYRNNPMQIHLKIHQEKPILKEHFNRWLSLFNQSVDDLFSGENSHSIKSRAQSIGIVMEIKLNN